MSKKDRIAELEAQTDTMAVSVAAANMVVQQIGFDLGITVEMITPGNASGYGALILTAIRALRQRARTEPGATSEDEALPGSRMEASNRDMDLEIDRANALAQNRHNADVPVTPLEVAGVIDAIARELDLDPGDHPPSEALRQIHQEMLRLKTPGDTAPETGRHDTLAQAIAHNAAERDHLNTELTRARALIGRVAAAMQIGAVDADGTQILEKVQRWESFKHVLRRRIGELRSGASGADQAIADELQAHLCRLMAPREFAKWLETKPNGVVTPLVALIARTAGSIEPFEEMGPGDIVRLSRLIRKSPDAGDALIAYLDAAFWAMAQSVDASREFCNLMNLVVLPILARQSAAQKIDQPTGEPTDW